MRYLFNPEKYSYIKNKDKTGCIMCAMAAGESDVNGLEIGRNELVAASVNLYPYNPGHILVFPLRHIEKLTDLTGEEVLAQHELVKKAVACIESAFSPDGYNMGYNIGNASGASISHLHLHIVPRFSNESGFMDVLAGTRLVPADPVKILEKLKSLF